MKSSHQKWMTHLGNLPTGYLFPRKIGNPRQVTVKTKEAYLKGLDALYDSQNLYVSLFSDWQKERSVYHTVYIDFDLHGDGSWEDMEDEVSILNTWFSEEHQGRPRQINSGRGFHLYFNFPPMVIPDYRNGVVNFFVFIKEHFNFKYFDYNIYNHNKISRIPSTMNLKADKFAIELPIKHKPSELFGKFFKGLSYKYNQSDRYLKTKDVVNVESDLDLLWNVAPFIKDGHKRILWQLVMPRLRTVYQDIDLMLKWVNAFLKHAGVDSSKYQFYIRSQLQVPTYPYRFSTFFYENPDLCYLKQYINGG